MSDELSTSAGLDVLRLGIAVSLSGRYALLGRQVLAGLQCYVEDANAAGGVRIGSERRAVELIASDDASDPKQCAERVKTLINDDRIDLLIGPYGSGLTFAAAKVAESNGMVLWNHSGSADQIFDSGLRMVVGIISPASTYLCSILELVRSRDSAAHRVVLLSAETGFAQDVAAGAEAWIERAGFALHAHHRYRSGHKDFRPTLRALVDDPPDCLLGVGRVEDDIQFARDLCELRPPVKAVGLVVAAIDEFRRELGTQSEGFLAPSQWEPQTRYQPDCGPAAEDFIAGFRRRRLEDFDYPAAQGYAGGLIAQQCVEAAGTLDQSALRAAANVIQATTFYGAFGIEPESGRQTAHGMLVTQWQDGRKQIVWPPAAAETAIVYPGPFWR